VGDSVVCRVALTRGPKGAKVHAGLTSATATFSELDAEMRVDSKPSAESNVVRAVMLNALGQLRSLAGRADDARKDFRRAMTLLPSFIEPAINLACLYIEKKASFDREWATRADRLLRDVLAADGGNVRALVLTGTLYMSPVFSRFDDAVKCGLITGLHDPRATHLMLLEQRDVASKRVTPDETSRIS
jgi:hypothetical protein